MDEDMKEDEEVRGESVLSWKATGDGGALLHCRGGLSWRSASRLRIREGPAAGASESSRSSSLVNGLRRLRLFPERLTVFRSTSRLVTLFRLGGKDWVIHGTNNGQV